MPLKDITTIDIEEWAIDILTEYHMTAKTFNTHKIVVMNALVYAHDFTTFINASTVAELTVLKLS